MRTRRIRVGETNVENVVLAGPIINVSGNTLEPTRRSCPGIFNASNIQWRSGILQGSSQSRCPQLAQEMLQCEFASCFEFRALRAR